MEGKTPRAGMVQVKEELMDVVMVGPISSILDDCEGEGRTDINIGTRSVHGSHW